MQVAILPLLAAFHAFPPSVRWSHQQRLLLMAAAADADDLPEPSEALTIGDLLAEVVARQQKEMPLEDQLALDDATMDAMLDRASRELATTFDDFSEDLFAAERNISKSLDTSLEEASSVADARIRRVSARLRREMIAPSRRIIQRELASLREAEDERKRQKAIESGTFQARARLVGRDEWWLSRLDKGGASVIALEMSAAVLGLLLLIGAVDLLSSFSSPGVVLGADIREPLVFCWRLSFAGTLVVYLFSLTQVTLTDLREPYVSGSQERLQDDE